MSQDDSSYRKMLRNLFPSANAKKVFVVSGSPGSGKTRYVKERITPYDLALDLDYISAALSLDDKLYNDRKPQLDVALAVRDTILQKVENHEGQWNNAYVITSEKDARKVQDLADRLGAEVIKMKTTQEQCIENIKNDPRRTGVSDTHIQLVKKWYQRE